MHKILTSALLLASLTSCSYLFNDRYDTPQEREDILLNRSEVLPLESEVLAVTGEKTYNDNLIKIESVKLDGVNVNPEDIKAPYVAVKEVKRLEYPANMEDKLYSQIRDLNTGKVERTEVTTTTSQPVKQVNYVTNTTATEVKAVEVEQPKTPARTKVSSSANATLGDCYGKIKVAAKYKTVAEKVVVEPEKVRTEIIPAKYAYKNVELVVKEASERYIQIPATYNVVNERVAVEPERKEIMTIPAQYRNVTERVMTKPAKKVWKTGRGLIEKQGTDGEILCLREEPAVYENISKRVLVAPERTETKIIPAVYKSIQKQVIAQPAKVQKIAEPAVKKTLQKKYVVEAEQTRKITVPAVYKTVTKKVPVTEEKIEWMPIVCNDNMREGLVSRVQAALVSRGHNLDIDGVFGGDTAEAVDKYQKSLGLESSGISLETLKALGISY